MRAVLAAGAALALVACGGGQTPATGAAYLDAVNGICQQLATDLQSSGPLPRSFRDPGARPRPQDLVAAATFLDHNVAILRGAATKLHAVPVPDGNRDLARQWLGAMDTFISDLAAAGDAARRSDAQTFTTATFETVPAAAADRDTLGAQLGVNGCG
ncbi:MAG TPA: hypothetical protein VH134_17725 [Candidatus Dormibacteraeota bacterium]|nr:hypothetical protein [Candidatus Dormibacteraeota bacterium]